MALTHRGGADTKYYAASALSWKREQAALRKTYPRVPLRPTAQADIDFDAAAAWKPRIVRKSAVAA